MKKTERRSPVIKEKSEKTYFKILAFDQSSCYIGNKIVYCKK